MSNTNDNSPVYPGGISLDLRYLRPFVAVAEERSFREAARRLHISQPPLTRQIRKLEAELGAELFDRSTRPIGLTPAGTAFLEEAILALSHAERAVERSRKASTGRLGLLSIGTVPWASNALLPSLALAFRSRAPEVTLDLYTFLPRWQINSLARGHLDVALVAHVTWRGKERELRAEALLTEPMVAIVAEDHPMAGYSEVTLEQLAAEPFVSLRQALQPELVAEQMALFRDHGLAPPAAQEAADPISLLSLIAAGAGVSMHVASFANLRRKGVAFIPLAGEAPTATLFALTRRDDDRPLVRKFIETALEAARSLEPPVISGGR